MAAFRLLISIRPDSSLNTFVFCPECAAKMKPEIVKKVNIEASIVDMRLFMFESFPVIEADILLIRKKGLKKFRRKINLEKFKT